MGRSREALREKPRVSPGTRAPELVELEDVPAAVVCARCGSADCIGDCFSSAEDATHASKVVAIVPWERPTGTWVRRLWDTARLATVNHNAFFTSLPAGEIGPAVIFAVLAETVTVGAHLALAGGLTSLLLPELAASVLREPRLLAQAIRVTAVLVPGLALSMVLLHAVHGFALDFVAARSGGKRRLGWRFGLYSCGWDLVTLPIGLVILACTAGPSIALRTAPLGLTLPPRAAHSYLKGVHHLDERSAVIVGRLAGIVAGVFALACSVVLVASVAAAVLFWG